VLARMINSIRFDATSTARSIRSEKVLARMINSIRFELKARMIRIAMRRQKMYKEGYAHA